MMLPTRSEDLARLSAIVQQLGLVLPQQIPVSADGDLFLCHPDVSHVYTQY